jgi:hypothetical protein
MPSFQPWHSSFARRIAPRYDAHAPLSSTILSGLHVHG